MLQNRFLFKSFSDKDPKKIHLRYLMELLIHTTMQGFNNNSTLFIYNYLNQIKKVVCLKFRLHLINRQYLSG